MGQEFKRLKYMGIVQKAFLSSLVEPSWSACKAKYTEHCTDEILKNFVPLFSTWVGLYLLKNLFCFLRIGNIY